ncbi:MULTISPECIES: phosphotriesterase family protein [Streptomycetaceae]|uniref:Phosphotriesterase-family protein n=1 Tax=Streptantibioticus cattleyicolor (strain ATCC 35852 / DSM 46488 / JCM 4925 / NBRC 14057 / NRRL 8057) TaxID=1003195 RepID=F8JNX8_STREN|nr:MULTISPECIES: phosphotriesterase [Streptomycetaceae]AEW93918.1 phosphotriesterase-family protein [Streptantibioticus cattleyicolor NRRL 8057 = DSM 46488]MYS58596.1 phosphotriesterase [Streptomyces sp. SID5468]CCB74265.1 putative phosphotriesterase-family protein [Streptantibioticus cattleyicolor NRRL 8057 = DSM 46488]
MTGTTTTDPARPAAVRTVLGDVPGSRLGVCDAHDHLFFRSHALPGQELDDPGEAEARLRAFQALGGGAVVQWSPYGTGRRAADLPGLARRTGVRIVAATGLHQAAHYPPGMLEPLLPRLAEVFTEELTSDMRGAPGVRAGLIKVAGAFHGLDDHARHVMRAAAEAHHATGAPIAVHHEMGTAVLDVLDLLCGQLAVPAHRVILGHLNRSPDLRLHHQAARSGAFLAFDGPSRANHATDWRLLDCLTALADSGHTPQLLLGADTTTPTAGPGMPYLLRVLRPRIERELGAEVAEAVLRGNPARAFEVEWR